MIISDIISKIDQGGPRGYYSFETLILNLLRHHIESQNKEFSIIHQRNMLGDGFAPTGFDSFKEPTLIEVKFKVHSHSFRQLVTQLTDQSIEGYVEHKFKTLLIITAEPIHPKLKSRLLEQIDVSNFPFEVVFWEPKELNKIVAKNRAKVNEIANNLFSLRLESAIGRTAEDWKIDRDDIVEKLKSCYAKGQFTLFLGAGVSSSAGMPDWNTLLNSLFVTYLSKRLVGVDSFGDDHINEMIERLNRIDEPSALMAARYLRKGLAKEQSETRDFFQTVTKNLYTLRNQKLPIDSDLLKSIAAMCLPRRTGAKVKSVITYNFDDLMERQLQSNSIQHRSIYTENESYDPDELPVYHVHGFLPENRNSYERLDNSTLVFSEEGYHQIYSESFHWSNLVQLSSFRENNCLMVGLSMTDPNLRRLLDISSRNIETSKHFAFMKRLSSEDFCFDSKGEEKVRVIKNQQAAEAFLNKHHALNEELMKELGVIIVWFESYDEIPEIINKIRDI